MINKHTDIKPGPVQYSARTPHFSSVSTLIDTALLPSSRARFAKELEGYPEFRGKEPGYYYHTRGYMYILALLNTFFRKLDGIEVLEIGSNRQIFQQVLLKFGAQPSTLDLIPPQPMSGVEFQLGDAFDLRRFFVGRQFDAILSRGVFEYGSDGLTSDTPMYKKFDEKGTLLYSAFAERTRSGGLLAIETFHIGATLIAKTELERVGFDVEERILPLDGPWVNKGNTPGLLVGIRN